MKKSFLLNTFFHIFIAVILMILINRLVSQEILRYRINFQASEILLTTANNCKHLSAPAAIMTCIKKNSSQIYLDVLIDQLVFCPIPNTSQGAGLNNICEDIDSKYTKDQQDTINELFINDTKWISYFFNGNNINYKILLSQKNIDTLTLKLFEIRNSTLIYLLPFLIFSIFTVSFYLSHHILKPIRQLSKIFKNAKPDHKIESFALASPYKEFNDFTQSYQSLNLLLNENILKSKNFLAYASHELRTPLTILRGTVEQLKQDINKGEIPKKKIKSIEEEVETLIDITEKLLILHQMDTCVLSNEQQIVCINDVVAEILSDYEKQLKDINIINNFNPKIEIHGDHLLINQLFKNFISNAIKYNHLNGFINFSSFFADKQFFITISNSSQFLHLPDQSFVFERFFRGENVRANSLSGHGLGLSICKEICKIHNIAVEAKILSTSFEIHLTFEFLTHHRKT